MKIAIMKQVYTEPQTNVSLVEAAGFICVSIMKMSYQVEVDEEDTQVEVEVDFFQ